MPNDGTPLKLDLGRLLPSQYNAHPENNKAPPPKGDKGSEATGSGLEEIEGLEPKPLTHGGLPFRLKR